MRLGAHRKSNIQAGLPIPYPSLENNGVRIRRGQTSLTVAAPGVGKSQLWANIAHRMKVPTLFWSADTDQHDVTVRSLALHTGLEVSSVEQKLTDDWWREWVFGEMGSKADHIDWVFDSPIDADVFGSRMKAFAEVHGEFPHLAVLDNLSNAVRDPANEYAEIKQIQVKAQQFAREANTHIAILHHAKGQYDSGDVPIPQSGAMQNPFKIPEVGLTINRPAGMQDRMHVYVVKNRGGQADPAAKHPIQLTTDFARSEVGGYREDN